jgi:tetratricopeptide (TPR) repeat protein
MPGTASPRGDEMRHIEWLPLFADREEARDQIEDFLRNLASSLDNPIFPVLQFYGVSGEGKSALFRRTKEYDIPRYPNVRFAFVDIDQMDPATVTKPVDVLWQIADALVSAGVFAPLTTCVYLHYWKRRNPGQELRASLILQKGYLERCIRGCEILSPFKDLLHTLSDVGQSSFKTLAVIQTFWAAALARQRELKITDLRGSDPGEWDLAHIESSFSEFLALDIRCHLQSHPGDNICIVLDTFERLMEQDSQLCERNFQDLCARLVSDSGELFGRSAIMLFGRERLRWARYDELYTQDPWSRYISMVELTGFKEPAAVSFLHNEYSEFWRARGAGEVPTQLVRYESEILHASQEKLNPGEPSTFLPYYLRLAGEIIYVQGDRFDPGMLGHSPEEMQTRFLKYLKERSPENARAVQVLALALYFDDDVFKYLVKHDYIQGIPVQGLVTDLLANRSYVRRFEESGRILYRFHRHMQQTLLDDLEKSQEGIEMARKSIDAILEYYAGCAYFSKPTEYVPETHFHAYEHGMDVLLAHAERGWIHPTRLKNWFWRFDEPFNQQMVVATREAFFERSLPIWSKLFGPDHLDTVTVLSRLAGFYCAQGLYQQAEPLYHRSLATHEKELGPKHPDTATALNNLAGVYCNQSQYEKAEPLYKRSLAISENALGTHHADTAIVLNNLAKLYCDQGQYAKAEPLYKRSLAIHKKALGSDDFNTAVILNNLASLYREQGRYAEAEPLYQRSLAICNNALGPAHPDTALPLNNLAGLYQHQGRYAEAEPLYQRSLSIREKTLGSDHPLTGSTLNNLAGLYNNQGRYAEAEALHKRSLAICEEILGAGHPNTAKSLNNLAHLYRKQHRYGEAEPLYRRSLTIVSEVLGADHPDTAIVLNNLGDLYRDQGQYGEAEPLYKRSLAIYDKALGPAHPDTAFTLVNLARLYTLQRRYAEREPLYKRLRAII